MGGQLTLRRAGRSDAAAMSLLEASSRSKPWSRGIFDDELAAENRAYLVAEDDGLVGFGGIMVIGDEAHVTNLLVDPERRRRGIGRRLMLALVDEAVAAGARHLTLEVRTRNEEARSLYADLGFAPVGVRKDYYGDDDALILWAHDIDQWERTP